MFLDSNISSKAMTIFKSTDQFLKKPLWCRLAILANWAHNQQKYLQNDRRKYFARLLSENFIKLTKYCSDCHQLIMAPSGHLGQIGPYSMKSKQKCKKLLFYTIFIYNRQKIDEILLRD